MVLDPYLRNQGRRINLCKMFVLLIKSELNLSLLVVDKERSRHVREAALVIT